MRFGTGTSANGVWVRGVAAALTMATMLVITGGRPWAERDNAVIVEGGYFKKYNKEIKTFSIDKHPVTVAEFDEFVKKTGYVTEAERYGSAGVFDAQLGQFVLIEGANYRFPFGQSGPAAEANHPVTQVSWNDAVAFASSKGKRLPTKEEWEFAASNRGKRSGTYTWGDHLADGTKFKANVWQGAFPFHNTAEDGYAFTSPVGAFGENDLGLTDMGGNVWQWCSNEVEAAPHEKIIDPSPRKLLKGGSYLCDPAVCHGYKIFGQSNSTAETAMAHIGFRCVADKK